jgi:lipopolysaccharide/colanic/teichoic acid biosynthesis glycosyltransferase
MRSFNSQHQLDYVDNHYDSNEALNEYPASGLSLVPVGSRLRSWQYIGVKRGIDVVLSTLMMIACLAPGLIIAAAIALTSKGPIFYREIRIGRGGRPFRIWKFRSMVPRKANHGWHGAASHFEVHTRWRTHKDVHDPRITTVGKFLRKWSLDELPQVFNVFRGDMSLVGPRPVVQAELPLYQHLLSFYLAATPGLSGLWQVSGRSNVSFSKRARLDALYVRSWSLRGDLVILARTVPAVLRRIGAR